MNTLSRYLDHPTVQFVTAAAADATASTVAVLKSTEKLSPGAKLLEAPLGSVQHSCLSSQFAFQCFNLPQLLNTPKMYHFTSISISIFNFDVFKMSFKWGMTVLLI